MYSMNKKLIALAVAAASLAVAGTASAAQIYSDNNTTVNFGGHVDARLYLNDNHHEQSHAATDGSRVRIHVNGKTQLTDNLYGIGYAQYNLGSFNNNGGSNYIRQAYAGIGSNTWGQVTYGKQYGALNNIANFTNVMPVYGGYANNRLGTGGRINDQIAYQGTFGGLSVAANYRLDPGSATPSSSTDSNTYATAGVKNGYGLSAIYNFNNGFAVGMGYGSQKETQGVSTKLNHSTNYMFGTSYSTDNLYLAGLYTTGKMLPSHNSGANDFGSAVNTLGSGVHDFQGYELVAQYFVMPKWQLGTAYNYSQFDGGNKVNHVQAANYLDLNTTYYFNKNFQAYLSYNINFLNDKSAAYASSPNIAKQNQVAMGATYYF